MTDHDLSRGAFSGDAPGQDLAEIVDRLSEDDLRKVLGKDVVALIHALFRPECGTGRLRRVAATMLRDRGENLLPSTAIREMCFRSMSSEKLKELARRLDIEDVRVLRTVDLCQDTSRLQTYLGFFGIDARRAVPFAMAPHCEEIHPDFGLFPHQRRMAERVREAVRGDHGRVVLHMPTGAGKTRTAMHVVSQALLDSSPAAVVWLAASRELLEQAADAFSHAWSKLGNRKIELIRFWGDYEPDLSKCSDCFIVAGLQKLHALKVRDPISVLRMGNAVRLVVVDEAHQAVAPTYQDVINTLAETGMNNALLGLTATPGRTWSDVAADQRLADFFGGRKVVLQVEGWEDPVSFLIEQQYLARPTFRRLEVEGTPELKQKMSNASKNQDYDESLLDSLSEHVDRNILIVDEIRRLIEEGHRRILFFASSVRHAEIIAAILMALEIDGRVVTANTETTFRTRIIKDFRREQGKPMVLCNFGVLTTGFDAPNTSAAVIARPTKSLVLFSQMVGRATRGTKAGGNDTCTISTIVDIDLPGFGNVAEAFTNWEDVWDEPK